MKKPNFQIMSTHSAVTNGVKCLVYGKAGSGKTHLCGTSPNPFIISAESGLLTLADKNIDYVEVKTYDQLYEVSQWVMNSKDASKYDTICLDSVTEVAEVVLADLKPKKKNQMQAYGEMQDLMMLIGRSFRNLQNKNVVFSAQEEASKDGMTGLITYGPLFPGTKLPQKFPYLFDEVFQMFSIANTNENGQPIIQRALRTQGDNQYQAKDRSRSLEQWETPDLSLIFNKIVTSISNRVAQ